MTGCETGRFKTGIGRQKDQTDIERKKDRQIINK